MSSAKPILENKRQPAFQQTIASVPLFSEWLHIYMATLVASNADTGIGRIALRPGINTVGRAEGNHHVISHASVSSRHCEFVVDKGTVSLRDFGSTNGTFIEGAKVENRTPLLHGQRVQIGDVEFVLDAPETALTTSGALRVTVHPLAPSEARPVAQTASEVIASIEPVLDEGPSFYRQIPGTFAYPFKQNGRILLFLGTICLTVMDTLTTSRVGPLAIVFGFVLRLAFTGYMFAFMQSIIQHTAQGEDAMPDFPEFSSWWSDIMLPFLFFVATMVVSFVPAIVAPHLIPGTELDGIAQLAMLVIGAFYFPMALLAVAMTDNFVALSPHVVLPSIVRVFIPYIVTFLLLASLIGIRAGAEFLATDAAPQQLAPKIVAALSLSFISLYLLTVEMRLLGLLFRIYRRRLGWM